MLRNLRERVGSRGKLPHSGSRKALGRSSLSIQEPELTVFKKFANGDVYKGQWLDGKPHGQGTYEWADGSVYDGSWDMGEKHGVGKYTWPSGASYEGDWNRGFMHGTGTHVSLNGGRYEGGWMRDEKHGLGRKVYPNGDSYHGLWRHGQPSGPGRYKWSNGNEYNGEWAQGMMHGRGTFVWGTGERYDGEWQFGREHGRGTFTWADGSTFDGFWREGVKHGAGVCHLAGAAPASALARWHARGSAGARRRLSQGGEVGTDLAALEAEAHGDESAAGAHAGQWVLLREYHAGQIVFERLLPVKGLPKANVVDKKERVKAGRDQRPTGPGETIFKGHRAYDLMVGLKLGIFFSASSSQDAQRSRPSPTTEDFDRKTKVEFPRRGSHQTPPHAGFDFKWTDYASGIFSRLRELHGIKSSDYMLSLCGDSSLRELKTPGKSGAVFYISYDDHFLVKTVHKSEYKLLRQMLPLYFRHMDQHPHSLLCRFFGLHSVTPEGGKKAWFVVMGNLFSTDLTIHRRYDLKGSTLGRFTLNPKPGSTLKDLDLSESFKLESHWHEQLMEQLDADTRFLAQMNIMDYSLLLGVHRVGGPGGADGAGVGGRPGTGSVEGPDGTETFDGGVGDRLTDEGGSPREAGAAALSSAGGAEDLGPWGAEDGAGGAVAGGDRARGEGAVAGPRSAPPWPLLGGLGGGVGGGEVLLSQIDPTDEELLRRLQMLGFRRDHRGRKALLGKSKYTVRAEAGEGPESRGVDRWGDPTFSTDQLNLKLGYSKVQLGKNMAAMALTKDGKEDGEVVLYFGVIDILQTYRPRKKMEHFVKSLFNDGNAVSVIEPGKYAHRFREFMREVFL